MKRGGNMAYSELIKSFAKIRDYVNQFYVYGFKSRNEYGEKSARSYDNERRRIESWLGDYTFYRQGESGKSVYLSVDSRAAAHNPFYSAFKAKSFTANDIALHFYILDILSDCKSHSVSSIISSIFNDYLSLFDNAQALDESTIRKKLNEYELLGLLSKSKVGREAHYCVSNSKINLNKWKDAVSFFSEADEIGVIGSYILDRYNYSADYFSFKHHYILHALESEILYNILIAINEKRKIKITTYRAGKSRQGEYECFPVKIYVSTQGGRRYLLAMCEKTKRFTFYRLDSIKSVKPLAAQKNADEIFKKYNGFSKNLWGVDTGVGRGLEHIEMTVFVGAGEEYIVNRLEREKRCASVERLDENHYKFTADVYSAEEMLPWLRTFIGRISSLKCSNKYIENKFYSDFEKMRELYGGDGE